MNDFSALNLTLAELDVNYGNILVSLALCVVFGFLLQAFYRKYSTSLNGQENIVSIIPVLTITVFLVISVVKSSLALSLGLVGALSIVRFRTPIKEPEELVFLFVAIAAGLGFGANQIVLTAGILTVILAAYWAKHRLGTHPEIHRVGLHISWESKDISIDEIVKKIDEVSQAFTVLRYEHEDIRQLYLEATMLSTGQIDQIFNSYTTQDHKFSYSVSKAHSNW